MPKAKHLIQNKLKIIRKNIEDKGDNICGQYLRTIMIGMKNQ